MGEYAKVPKAALEFAKLPKIKEWLATVQRERTQQTYAYELMRLLSDLKKTPEELLETLETKPKETSIEVKTALGSMPSKVVAAVRRAAVKSFAEFYNCDLRLNGLKIRPARSRRKPYLSWDDAERIIIESKEPYRGVFRFMLWGGIGCDEFAEIQAKPDLHAAIEQQRADAEKQYVRIDLRPRKTTLDTYFILVPKQFAPRFPVLTLEYGNRGGQPIGSNDLETTWQRASKRAGLRQIGMGPHTLRSAFRSQCARAKVELAVAEFQMGHGAGDKYGYAREVEDEEYVASELAKIWKRTAVVTEDELASRDKQITDQAERITQLEAQIKMLRVFELLSAQEDAKKAEKAKS